MFDSPASINNSRYSFLSAANQLYYDWKPFLSGRGLKWFSRHFFFTFNYSITKNTSIFGTMALQILPSQRSISVGNQYFSNTCTCALHFQSLRVGNTYHKLFPFDDGKNCIETVTVYNEHTVDTKFFYQMLKLPACIDSWGNHSVYLIREYLNREKMRDH